MNYRCPGQSRRNITADLYKCSSCGYQVEIFSDEIKVDCPRCGNPVYRDKIPSCVDWCPKAERCVGEEIDKGRINK